MHRPTLVSLFTGAGGLDLGLEDAGFETIFANEIEPAACETLRANRVLRRTPVAEFPAWFRDSVLSQRCYKGIDEDAKFDLSRRLRGALETDEHYLTDAVISEKDIRELSCDEILNSTGKKVGDIDLVAGGPPCQPFSRAGKRELVDCSDGQLFQEFVRIVDGLRPRWFLFENVKGLVIHKADVATLRCPHCRSATLPRFEDREALKDQNSSLGMCSVCGESGTMGVEWISKRAGSLDIIVNEFQRIGYACDYTVLNAADFGAAQSRERVILVGSRDGEKVQWPRQTHLNPKKQRAFSPTLFDVETLGSAPTVREVLFPHGHWKYGKLDPSCAVLWVKNVVRPHDEPVTWSLDGPAPTVGAHQAAKLAIAPFGVPEAQLARQQWHTLGHRQGDTPPVFVEHEYLSDEELLRLQTFPASWYLHGTRMQRAFQIGNAVPPVLAKAVGKVLLQAIQRTAERQLERAFPTG